MQRIDETIDVHVPAAAAYEQWARFEDYPAFVENVVEVKRQGDRLLWVALRRRAGRRGSWSRLLAAIRDRPPKSGEERKLDFE